MENFNKKYKQKNPFTLPEGYFDNLTERVMERIEEKEQPKVGKLRQLKPYMGWVAIFIVTIALYSLLSSKEQYFFEKNAQQESLVLENAESNTDEYIFDSDFHPTAEEIIEYLAVEVEDYEFIIAGIY